MNNQWSDNLRKKMEMHQEPSPEGLWEDIEQIIQEEYSIKPLSKKQRVLLWYKRIGAVAATVTILFAIGYIISDRNSESTKLAIETLQKQNTPDTNTYIADETNNLIAKNDSGLSPQKVIKVIQAKDISIIDTIGLIAEVDENIQKIVENNSSNAEEELDQIENRSLERKKDQDFAGEPALNLYEIKHKDKSSKWATNLYASNLSAGSTNRHDGYGSLSSSQTRPEGCNGEPGIDQDPHEDPFGDILSQNKNKDVYTDIKHNLPITMGLTLNYNIDEKWSISSGLTYTILSSQLRSGSDAHYYDSEQTLHNIGIPLSINYNIWKNKRVSIYLSGGGIVEKNVSGKLTTDYIIDNKPEPSKKENISIDELFWSLNTSVGIQYNLSKKIGLYVEPGAIYHFDNGTEIETIYKEKPLNINLRFGISFSLGSR